MSNIIERFGAYISKELPQHPDRCRALLLAAFRAYRLKLRFAAPRALPPSRKYISILVNKAVVNMLAHPDRAALTSVFLPCELLWAMDLEPMCAELYSAFINGAQAERGFVEAAEQSGIAETYCSYHKVLLGGAYAGVLPKPRVVVNTSLICDANNLTFRALARHYGLPQFYVDVPPRQDEDSVRYVADQFRELRGFLEEHTGRKLDEARLCAAVAHSRATIEAARAAIPLKRVTSLPGDVTSELYELYTTHIGLGTPEAQRYGEMLLDDLRGAPPAHGLRLLWLHTAPQWQAPIRDKLSFNPNYQILTCDMNYEGLVDMDPEHPYESMARRLVYSAWNGGGQGRVDKALELARDLDVDGVICFCHWGCKQTMGLSARFKQVLEEAGYPTLILNGDGCDRSNTSDGQIATRLNAFLEMLEGRK